MRYRKFKADYLFDGKEILEGDLVLITTENGTIHHIVTEENAGNDIEVFSGLLSPGFINCHCHLELSHMKNIAPTGTGLVDFLITVIKKRGFDKAVIDEAIKTADEEMYKNGIVSVADICNTRDTIQTKLASKILYHNFIEAIGFTEDNAATVFERFKNVYNDFLQAGLANTSIVPHAPYTISESMFKLINKASNGKIVSIHNQETAAENALYQNKSGDFFRLYQQLNINTDFFKPYGKTSLQYYLPLLDKAKTLLLVHNTFTNQADINFAKQQSELIKQKISWCLCPNANLYIEEKITDTELFIKNNCNIIVGTDSYSSNWHLSILEEMKTLQQHFPSLEIESLLQWATGNGAAALGIAENFGSFEKGKKPGIVLVENVEGKKFGKASVAKRIL